MTSAPPQSMTLQTFLQLPNIDESPAWEYSQGVLSQKTMGGSKHSLLQKRLVAAVDATGSPYEAFPELRCTFGGRSIVPDVVVVISHRLPIDEDGEVSSSGITFAPDWVIEILSPNQSQTRVTGNILHCLQNGTQLGWLIDPQEKSVLCYEPDRLPLIAQGATLLPCLQAVNLNLSAEAVFRWLKRRDSWQR
ncbi:MAG: Uma2 family endonuclease [Cyanobacteria bacterium P01_F01_bin.86]